MGTEQPRGPRCALDPPTSHVRVMRAQSRGLVGRCAVQRGGLAVLCGVVGAHRAARPAGPTRRVCMPLFDRTLQLVCIALLSFPYCCP